MTGVATTSALLHLVLHGILQRCTQVQYHMLSFFPCWLRKCEALVKHALLTADAYCLLEPVATVLGRHAAW